MSKDFSKLQKGLNLPPMAGSDPVDGQNGDIYYNFTLDKFRKFEAGVWSDLDSGGGGGGLNIAVFTASDVWVVPAGVTKALVFGTGGGGGGAGRGGLATGGNGCNPRLALAEGLVPGTNVNITIGAGGTGRTGSSGPGGNGGTSTFSDGTINLRFKGANGGSIQATTLTPNPAPFNADQEDSYGGGASGSANGNQSQAGQSNIYASGGAPGTVTFSGSRAAAGGGGAGYGPGGKGGNNGGAGQTPPAGSYGAGGGGGGFSGGTLGNGAAGSSGIIIVMW